MYIQGRREKRGIQHFNRKKNGFCGRSESVWSGPQAERSLSDARKLCVHISCHFRACLEDLMIVCTYEKRHYITAL